MEVRNRGSRRPGDQGMEELRRLEDQGVRGPVNKRLRDKGDWRTGCSGDQAFKADVW